MKQMEINNTLFDKLPEENSVYRHFKGEYYKIVGLGIQTETRTIDVIYKTLTLQPYLASAMRRGIVNGMVSERGLVFRPNEPVTAGQAAVMLQNMLELPVSAAVSQTDAPYWAASSMQALQEAGIPLAAADTSVSRIEAARMLYRVSRLPK